MDVDRHADRALYLQLADVLREDITGGLLQPGQRLPSEADLIERHGVSRGTVRDAIALLRNEGVLVVEHGRGAFVRATEQQPLTRSAGGGGLLGARETFERDAQQAGLTPTVRQIGDPQFATLASDLAASLGLESAKGTASRLLCFADGRPLQVLTTWQPARVKGRAATRAEDQVAARMPTREERRLLQLDDGAPVLVVERILADAGAAIEHSETVMAAGRQQLRYSVPD